eukprot:1191688-Prorocentrum_minimum.AAC.2
MLEHPGGGVVYRNRATGVPCVSRMTFTIRYARRDGNIKWPRPARSPFRGFCVPQIPNRPPSPADSPSASWAGRRAVQSARPARCPPDYLLGPASPPFWGQSPELLLGSPLVLLAARSPPAREPTAQRGDLQTTCCP